MNLAFSYKEQNNKIQSKEINENLPRNSQNGDTGGSIDKINKTIANVQPIVSPVALSLIQSLFQSNDNVSFLKFELSETLSVVELGLRSIGLIFGLLGLIIGLIRIGVGIFS